MVNLFFLLWGLLVDQFARSYRSWHFWTYTIGTAVWLTMIGIGMVLTAIGVVILAGTVA